MRIRLRPGGPSTVRSDRLQRSIEQRPLLALTGGVVVDHVLEPLEIAASLRRRHGAASRTWRRGTARSPITADRQLLAARRTCRQRRPPWRRLGRRRQAVEVRDHVGDFLIGQLGLEVRRHAAERVAHVARKRCVRESSVPRAAARTRPVPRRRGSSSTTYCRTRSAPCLRRRLPTGAEPRPAAAAPCARPVTP